MLFRSILFINKMDREGQEPYQLLEEVERELSIHTCPLSWPIGIGENFKGVYNRFEKQLLLFHPNKTRIAEDVMEINDISSKELDNQIGTTAANKLRDDVELIAGIYEPFDQQLYSEGYLAPVFFGSAINNFGVKELLDTFVQIGRAHV